MNRILGAQRDFLFLLAAYTAAVCADPAAIGSLFGEEGPCFASRHASCLLARGPSEPRTLQGDRTMVCHASQFFTRLARRCLAMLALAGLLGGCASSPPDRGQGKSAPLTDPLERRFPVPMMQKLEQVYGGPDSDLSRGKFAPLVDLVTRSGRRTAVTSASPAPRQLHTGFTAAPRDRGAPSMEDLNLARPR